MGWLLTTQSILLAGYGLLIRSKLIKDTKDGDVKEIENVFNNLIDIFPYVGFFIAVFALTGVVGAIISFYINQEKRRNSVTPKDAKGTKLIISEVFGWSPAIGFPVLFLIVWLKILN